MSARGKDLTEALEGARAGDAAAIDRLYQAAYAELRIIARARLRSGSSPTLNTTALVNEAYLKLFEGTVPELVDRQHFFAVSARAMRHILVDYFRARASQKRGAGADPLPLEDELVAAEQRGELILAVHDALERLTRQDERLARVVECKFFGGMTEKEIAAVFGVTTRTISSDWRLARAWLANELGAAPEGSA